MNLDALASCAELTVEHADEASASAASMRELLQWAARTARPGHGAPKILMALARLAQAEWLEGTPSIEIVGDEKETKLSVFGEHGMGIRERVFPFIVLRVPIDEFARAIRLAPQLIAPFHALRRGDTLLLSPPATDDDVPEPIAIDERSLHEQERKTAPPPAEIKTKPPPAVEDKAIHNRPTVPRMVAVLPEAFRSKTEDKGRDPQ